MNTGTLVVIPCLPVGRAELAEARRALAGQGRNGLTDEMLARGLWTARALPAIVEVLLQSGETSVDFTGIDIESAPTSSRSPLSVLAWRHDDELVVEVLFLRDDDLALRSFENAVCRLMVGLRRPPVRLQPDGEDALTADDNVIRLQRFTFGARGKPS